MKFLVTAQSGDCDNVAVMVYVPAAKPEIGIGPLSGDVPPGRGVPAASTSV